jgi:hypothetical protein
MMKTCHSVCKLCSCPTQRATISQQAMLWNLSLAWSCRESSHSQGFPALQFLSALPVAGCNTFTGAMAPCTMACILMVISMRMLWHTEMQDGRSMKSKFTPGTVMALNTGPQNAFPMKGGRFRLILVTHDESVFYQNDFRKTHWIASTSKATPLPKGDGQSIMVSDFLTAEWGHLLDKGSDHIIESVFNSLKVHFIFIILQ